MIKEDRIQPLQSTPAGASNPLEWMCSRYTAARDEDPVGMAVTFDVALAIETPLPWNRIWTDAGTIPDTTRDIFQAANAGGMSLRPLAIAPDPVYSVNGHRRIIHFKRPQGPFARFERSEFVVPERLVDPLLEALLLNGSDAGAFDQWKIPASHDVRDLMVCTHGHVDPCCGKYGYPAFKLLRETQARENLRVWRVSHFGAHRFAPTLLDMPEGRYWGRLTPDGLSALANRTGAVSDISLSYRGWVGAGYFAQFAEREAFALEGWEWTGYAKSSRITSPLSDRLVGQLPAFMDESPANVDVAVDFQRSDGSAGSYSARLEYAGSLAVKTACGSDSVSPVNQYTVVDLTYEGTPRRS